MHTKRTICCTALSIVLTLGAVGCSFIHLPDRSDDTTGESETEILTENQDDTPHDFRMGTVTETLSDAEPDEPSAFERTNTPTLSIPYDSLLSEMERMEENELFPADRYSISVTEMSTPVTLYMQQDCVTAIEAYGHYVELTEMRDIYGNCSFDLFEADGAVVLEGGFYEIGDVYILSPEKCTELHPGTDSSYWLYSDDSGSLKYLQKHNDIALITQTGALSCAVAYDEFFYASGDAQIQKGELFLADPTESYTISDKYDLDKEFRELYSNEYSTIEEKFEANLSARSAQ